MKTIGITGGVGAGKSAVLEYLADNYNCDIIMTDDVAKGLYAKGSKTYEMMIALIGEDIVDESGEIDKKKLADIIFSNANKRMAVNSIVHPAVKQEVITRITNNKIAGILDYTFVESALLLTEHYDVFCDEVWYIDTSEDIRRRRLKESRGYSDEKIDNILKSQQALENIKDKCSYCIDNNKDLEYTFRQIQNILLS